MSQETTYTTTAETADTTVELTASPRHRYQIYMTVSRDLLLQQLDLVRAFVRMLSREWPGLHCSVERVNTKKWWSLRISWTVTQPVSLSKMRKMGKQFFLLSPWWITTRQPRNSGLYAAPGKELCTGTLPDIVARYTH